MGINSCHYQPINFKFGRTSVIDNYRQSMRGNKFSFNKVDSDTFVSTASEKTFEMGELERLFPNGEINKIYNNIVKEYGLEKPPKLKLISNSNSDDYASSFQISNAIDLNLDNLVSKNMYKFKIKQAGKEFYSYDNDQNRIVIIKTDDKSVINSITEYNKSLGADECFA